MKENKLLYWPLVMALENACKEQQLYGGEGSIENRVSDLEEIILLLLLETLYNDRATIDDIVPERIYQRILQSFGISPEEVQALAKKANSNSQEHDL